MSSDLPQTVPLQLHNLSPPPNSSKKFSAHFFKIELNDRNYLGKGFPRENGISTTLKLQDFFFPQKKRKTRQIIDILSQTSF